MRVLVLLAAGAAALTACDALAPADVAPAPAAAQAAEPPPDLTPFVGQSYTDLITAAATSRYSAANLNMSEAARARFAKAMSLSAPAWIVEGGGSSAFIVVGCEAGACPQAAAILAVDTRTGDIYAAVRDQSGRDVLINNDRLEALVEATSPADLWDDPEAWAEGAPSEEPPT